MDHLLSLCLQMDNLLSQKAELSELKEGDHVYTWRRGGLYTHHGIYIGDGKIINFVQINKSSIFASSSASSASYSNGGSEKISPCCLDDSYCGSEKVAGSGVRLSCIACFTEKSFLYRYKYNVSSEFLIAKVRPGTCTTASSDPQEKVMHRVNYLYENGYGEYDLMKNNCEDFALYCMTGLWSTDKDHQGRSSQADMAHGLLGVVKELIKGAWKDPSIVMLQLAKLGVVKELMKGGWKDPLLLMKQLATLGVVKELMNGSNWKDLFLLMQQLAKVVPNSFSIKEYDLGKRKDLVKTDVENLSSFISSLEITS